MYIFLTTSKFFRSCNRESLLDLRPWCSMDHYLLNDHLVVWSWTSMFMVVYVCIVVSWVSESIIQALMNLCVHYVMFNLMSLLTQHSSFALSSSIIHLLTHCSRVSFIFTLKFLSLSVFLSWVFISEHGSFDAQGLGLKNQWSKFCVCVLCSAKLLIWIYLYCYKHTQH